MPSYSKGDVVLLRYPFSDQANFKVRPAIAVSAPHPSQDFFVVPLTSKTASLLPGEFVIADSQRAGLNVTSAIGTISSNDAQELERSLRGWLGL